MLGVVLLFSVMRPHNSVVYAPKTKYADAKHAPPHISKGLFAWFGPVATVHEKELVQKVGLDATVFLRFTKMCRNIFGVITIISCGVVLPTNLIAGRKTAEATHTKGFYTLSTSTNTRGSPLWVHVISVWVINLVLVFFLWHNYRAVTRLRKSYFESQEYQHSLHSRTLMFSDIPADSRTDEGILRLADRVEQTTGLPRAAIARNVKELPEMIEEHEKMVRKLESVLSKYLKNPDKLPSTRPTIKPSRKYRQNNGNEKVDAIDYLTDRITELEMEIKHVRESVDKRNAMPYGFASYERIEDAHTVAYAARNKKPQGTTIRLAPKPNDLIWKNLPLSKKDRSWKRFINNFWIAVLTFVWIAPNALIAIFLTSLQNLASFWHGFKTEMYAHPKFWAVVQGIASPALTSLLYLILPIIFRRLSIHAGDRTKTSRERHVTTKLYAFFVFNNLIVFSVFSTVFTFIKTIVESSKKESAWDAVKEGKFLEKMLYGLIQISNFWVTWLLQRNLGTAADISQIWNLTYTYFMRTFWSPTPRQAIEWTAPPPMDYAVYYNYFLFNATVAFCFMTIQPLVVPVTALYFLIDYWMKKYLLLYVLITKTESGGQFWRILFNRLIFAIIFADIVIAMAIAANGTYVMMGVTLGAIILIVAFKVYCVRTFDDQNDFFTKAELKDPERLGVAGKKTHRVDRVTTKFGHPALYAKLIVPMVHAKSQHLLRDIYRGRLRPESLATPGQYSDIALDPMSQQYPGKAARFAPDQDKNKPRDLFEVVPESQLDFGYFKERADFAGENGGDGELFGRPADLISERSGTPRSFMGHGRGGSDSPSSSRASSPSGDIGSGYHSRNPSGPIQHVHPAYRDASPMGGHVYQANADESRSNLLRGAQPVGFDEPPPHHEVYGLDRWRTGGSGYMGVPGMEPDQGTGYEAYRGGR